MRARSRDLVSEADGFTLVEMLVAVVLSLIVIAAAVMMFTAALRSQPRVTSVANAIQQARTTMERMVRELRQGTGIVAGTIPSGSRLSIVTYVDSTCGGTPTSTATQCSVTYACATNGTCTRQVAKPDGTSPGPAVPVISGLSSPDIFTYSPPTLTPTYVGVTLSLPAQGQGGGNAITLSDGAAFRNATSVG